MPPAATTADASSFLVFVEHIESDLRAISRYGRDRLRYESHEREGIWLYVEELYGKAIGIGVGAAAAGAGAIYLMTHRSSKITGCVESADDGLHLTDSNTKKTLSIVPGAANVKSGERVELKGKIKKNSASDQSFIVKSVAKDLGQCRTQANSGPASALNSQAK